MAIYNYARYASRAFVLIAGCSAASLSAADYAGSESGIIRSFRFWKGMVPIYAHYKIVERRLKDETDPTVISAAYAPLNERYSPRVEKLALDLKGFYYKLAQIMSTRDDFLPDVYQDWTKKLQDKSPSVMQSEDAKALVERSLNVKVNELFSEWEDDPIGAASIGQVHRARIRETGQEVAVKIQYPGIEEKFRADIDTVEMFCKYLMPQNTAYFAEIRRQFETEFDARGEAENLRLVHDNLHRAGWNRLVEVPEPLHSSKDVLVMTYLEGPKLVDGVRAQFKKIAERQGRTLEELEAEHKRKIESGELERKDVSTSAAEMRRIQTLLRLKDGLLNSLIFAGNWTVRPFISSEKWEYVKSDVPINLGQILDTLLRVHAHEIFTDGAFNGDPHPGNILLMPDGRLGLIDYGQVKRMALEDRIEYAKMIISLNRGDKEEVVRIAKESGFRTKRMDEDIIYRTCAFWHCRDSEDILQGMNVSEFIEYLEEKDPVKNINDENVMAGRVSVLLRGMANAFGMKLKVSDYWREEAETFLKAQGIEY